MNKRKMIGSIFYGVVLLIGMSPFLWAAEDPGTLVMETIDRAVVAPLGFGPQAPVLVGLSDGKSHA